MGSALETKPRIGLALGSGSSRGWAHIGVIKALARHGIEPDVVTGCSIGALVGAAYVTDHLDKLERWVCSLDRLDVARFFEISTSFSGFVNKDKFHKFLNQHVCRDDTQIESLDKAFAVVATDLASGTEVWFSRGALIEAVWASISLPGLFPAIRHKNRWLVDGGLVNPVPISTCRSLGADVVIAVNLNGDIAGKHFKKMAPKVEKVERTETEIPADEGWIDTLTRTVREYSMSLFTNHKDGREEAPDLFDAIAGSINITQDRITRFRIASDPPDILITPRLMHISLLEFHRAKEAIEAGEAMIETMLPEIQDVVSSV
ncbi:patatin [Candidatus Tenderia electrophaga]|jgi:NTE family protein|uniref:Patatin n=1 Tax=Candidatus Tenderia electrophaga TaxID=1748243 RepID=A0A0S2TC27_9GAMM|nr:patatin [Candidatus Tenderia electrophaga]